MRTILAFVCLLFLTACNRPSSAPNSAQDAPSPTTPPAPSLELGKHVWNTSDGNEIPYEITGHGDATVVLIHCWMCNATFWEKQVPELAKHWRVVNLDLPGHGQAGRTRAEWKVERFAEDVAGLLQTLNLSNVVLVGHSMGGPIALKTAALARGRVRGIVGVDTLHDAEFEFSGPQIEGFLKAFEADFKGTCEGFIDQMIPEPNVEATKLKVKQAGCNPERSAIGLALMKDFGTIDTKTWMKEAGVPIRAINAAKPNPTKIDVNRKYADFDAVLMEGVGHYPHMTKPEEFNRLLVDTISKVLALKEPTGAAR